MSFKIDKNDQSAAPFIFRTKILQKNNSIKLKNGS